MSDIPLALDEFLKWTAPIKAAKHNADEPVLWEHMERFIPNYGYLGVGHAMFDADRKLTDKLVAGGYIVYGNYYGIALYAINEDMTLTKIEME